MPAAVKSVSSLSTTEKLEEVFSRVGNYAGDDVGQALKQFITKRNLEIMAATLVAWGVAQIFGVGEVVDIILLAGGVYALGANAVNLAEDLFQAGMKTVNAQTDEDLSMAAQYLAKAIVEGGIEVVLALLMRKDLGEIKIKFKALQNMKPGLARVPSPPAGGTARLKIKFEQTLGKGANYGRVRGKTDVYGQITVAKEGWAEVTQPDGAIVEQWVKFTAHQKMQTILHEIVHRALSPKTGPLREFRAAFHLSYYKRVYLLQYLEEAVAESYSLAKTDGLSGIWTGIKFPIKNGYVEIWPVLGAPAKAGAAITIGEFFCAGHKYRVGFELGHPSSKDQPIFEWAPAQ